MNLNYPCICGHSKQWHPGFFEDTPFCYQCWKTPNHVCEIFLPDNLKYLEIKEQESNVN